MKSLVILRSCSVIQKTSMKLKRYCQKRARVMNSISLQAMASVSLQILSQRSRRHEKVYYPWVGDSLPTLKMAHILSQSCANSKKMSAVTKTTTITLMWMTLIRGKLKSSVETNANNQMVKKRASNRCLNNSHTTRSDSTSSTSGSRLWLTLSIWSLFNADRQNSSRKESNPSYNGYKFGVKAQSSNFAKSWRRLAMSCVTYCREWSFRLLR